MFRLMNYSLLDFKVSFLMVRLGYIITVSAIMIVMWGCLLAVTRLGCWAVLMSLHMLRIPPTVRIVVTPT